MARNRKEAVRISFVTMFIDRSSLPYKTDSVTIIFQHILGQSSLYFLNKKIFEVRYFILIFVHNLQLFMFTGL